MRLFVAVWPPPDVVTVLGAMPRPALRGVRWTPAGRWHVTLAFLGDVAGREQAESAGAALGAAARRVACPPEAVLGPTTSVLGRSVLCVRVGGLEAAATAVRTATLGRHLPVDPTPFAGHLTLARVRGAVPADLVGIPLVARWVVERLRLVAVRPGSGMARYETVAEATVQ
jgi:2'-5' RNA ligase